jgi:hypothetical protein
MPSITFGSFFHVVLTARVRVRAFSRHMYAYAQGLCACAIYILTHHFAHMFYVYDFFKIQNAYLDRHAPLHVHMNVHFAACEILFFTHTHTHECVRICSHQALATTCVKIRDLYWS